MGSVWERWSRRTRLSVSGLLDCLLLFIVVGNLAKILSAKYYIPLFVIFLVIIGSGGGVSPAIGDLGVCKNDLGVSRSTELGRPNLSNVCLVLKSRSSLRAQMADKRTMRATQVAKPPKDRTEEILRRANEAVAEAESKPDSEADRVAAFLCVEFYKCLFDEVGAYANLSIKQSYDLPHKFKLARGAMPLLEEWARLIDEVEELRNKISHTDYISPGLAKLRSLISQAPKVKKSLQAEVARRNTGLSDAQLIDDVVRSMKYDLEQLGATLGHYNRADQWDQTLSDLVGSIESLKKNIAEHDPPSLSLLLQVARWCASELSNLASEARAAAESDAMMDAAMAQEDERRGYGGPEPPDYSP